MSFQSEEQTFTTARKLAHKAGPNDESDGLFGTLVPIGTELSEADEP
jgi:hypothetical protein